MRGRGTTSFAKHDGRRACYCCELLVVLRLLDRQSPHLHLVAPLALLWDACPGAPPTPRLHHHFLFIASSHLSLLLHSCCSSIRVKAVPSNEVTQSTRSKCLPR